MRLKRKRQMNGRQKVNMSAICMKLGILPNLRSKFSLSERGEMRKLYK